MLREFKISRQSSGKNPSTDGNDENLPLDPIIPSASQQETDPSRPPFNTIQEPAQNHKLGLDQETHFRKKNEKTPSKINAKRPDHFLPLRTPEKLAVVKGRFGLIPKGEQSGLTSPDLLYQAQFMLPPPPPLMASNVMNIGNGYCVATPRSLTMGGKASSVHSGTSSTQSTPTKSITKPNFNGVSNSRAPQCGGTARAMNFLVSSKGIPLSCSSPSVYVAAQVPHFDLKEDPSFWMDHNVQVVIRVRPINSMERSLQGYSRCIKQESAQSITWIGQSETRLMFDYIACETVNQEMLFRVAGLPMVENCMSGYNSCVFAYGQTGSGKTHTMLGEINDLEIRPSPNRGMIPRIFEFLFTRIKAEEESRRDEKLQYSCKCSFLEIYNEQITDLLNPSSTNLLIREDSRKGVYVENLTEYQVENVFDILKLLIQGAANRKVAATNMNRESSRSHSVFTCTIESRWQTDSTSTFRFARLNLVDLAGSERQKTSGAEGDRLKEASSMNKSLSTLGHVIMVLADLANGRQRHVPYRDSRLTFLLQDSLGGNSKTMIIANVSPSICSANETLSTLKFAQRAKIIQNNAVVNEDASGDALALQHQILLLKEELSMLKQQNVSRSLSFRTAMLESANYDGYSPKKLPGILPDFNPMHNNEELQSVRVLSKQLKSLEATLSAAFRREKMAAIATRQLEAEIEQLNRLANQREEDTQCSKMMIKFREDKIYRMEALLNGLISSESYLCQENKALSEEIKLLRTKVEINPEVTRFAGENIRLREQLRKFHDFYEEGERDNLLADLSDLRNQLAQHLHCKFKQQQHSKSDFNAQEISLAIPKEVPCSCSTKHAEEVLNLELEIDILKSIIAEEKSLRKEVDERALLAAAELSTAKQELLQISKIYDATIDKLNDARSVIEALESQQILSINELEELRENNNQLEYVVKIQEQQLSKMRNQLGLPIDAGNKKSTAYETLKKGYSEKECSPLQEKLKRVQDSLEKAWNLNMRYQSDQASHTSDEREMDEVRRQVEAETAEVIVCLQEELATVNQIVDDCKKNELLAKQRLKNFENERKEQDDKLHWLTQENTRLAKLAEEKEQEAMSILEQWKQIAYEISDLLENGNTQLDDATHEVASMSDVCSHNSWISELSGKIIWGISKRDSLIEKLQKNLEEACNARHDMESKLRSLRGATLAITEAQQQENCDRESRILSLTSLLAEKTSIISELENKVNDTEKRVRKRETFAIMEALQQENCEKESRILSLTSLLAEKTSIISELENKVDDAEKRVRKHEICAVFFFIIVLNEINKVHLQSLKDVQSQMAEILDEKEEIKKLMLFSQDSIKGLTGEIHRLNSDILNQEEEFECKLLQLEEKLNTVEENAMTVNFLWRKQKEIAEERKSCAQVKEEEVKMLKRSVEELECTVNALKEQLEMTESLAELNEAVAIEARQIAEERKSYAQVKEEEVKLLEKSVEELECTINALQEQVKIVIEEAERQRLQRNKLEMEEDAVSDTAKRSLKEKLIELEDAQHNIQLLQKEVAKKELELVQCKSIISELNLHAEAQASEYKRKFKELEAMAFEVKSELVAATLTSTKSEKGAVKSRGSGSPFKCMGLGLVQQINTEKEEELTVARCKIEELEALAANRQKQIFMLNVRLAAAEGMTHDVLRDLLGIKLDMAKYTKMNEKSETDDFFKEKEDKEWGKLKKQVDDFVEERQSLLEEINQKQKELLAAQIKLEKLQQHEQFVSAENELLKIDNTKYKNIVMELEEELEIFSSRLNIR